MKVLIQNNKVHEIFGNQAPKLHPSLLIVDAPDTVKVGWEYDNGSFSEPVIVEPTYAEKRAQEYPPIGDQLDALFKAGVFPADMAASIQAVKDKYPKGTV